MSTVTTSVAGEAVTITYEAGPETLDGLSSAELVETVVGLIPALLHAATYTRPDLGIVSEVLRTYADVWNPEENDE